MLGLVLKDFLSLKKNLKIFGFLILFYSFLSFMMEGSSFFGSMFTLVFAMLLMTTYSYDELTKWDSYALTMPITKENIIQAKYVTMLILAALGFIISSFFTIIINVIRSETIIYDGIQLCAIGAAFVILFYSVTIPFVTKLGIEKARFIFMIVYMIPFLIGTLGFKALKERYTEPPVELIKLGTIFIENIFIIIPIVVVLALGISYLISVRIYKKKEF